MPYQYSRDMRGEKTLQFYKNLNLEACIWEFENWFNGQPSGDKQTHVAMNFESSGQWNDEYKNSEKTFICHYKGIKFYIFIICY